MKTWDIPSGLWLAIGLSETKSCLTAPPYRDYHGIVCGFAKRRRRSWGCADSDSDYPCPWSLDRDRGGDCGKVSKRNDVWDGESTCGTRVRHAARRTNDAINWEEKTLN
jgi:hypothetical protein